MKSATHRPTKPRNGPPVPLPSRFRTPVTERWRVSGLVVGLVVVLVIGCSFALEGVGWRATQLMNMPPSTLID